MAPAVLMNDGNGVYDNKADGNTPFKSAVLHRSLHIEPYKVVGSKGNYLHLANGQKIFDATTGAAVACLGHGNERVKAAVARQMDEICYCHSMFFNTSATEGLADELITGTEGKLARAFLPDRTRFIARKESYHGTTLGSLSMSGHVSRRKLFEPMLLENISRVSACNPYHGMRKGESTEDFVAKLAQELDDEFQRVGPGTVCAFVAEPTVGAALGCVPAVPGYFPAMKAVCDKYGALLILDEIMSGMGRTGTLHAWQQEGVVPDIQTIGKGLGGGFMPIAGMLIGHRVVDAFKKGTGAFSHGQTYQGHPLACAAALEVQKIIREEKLVDNVREMGLLLEGLLKQKLADHPNVGDIRGRGLFWGIEFVRDKTTKKPFDPKEGIAMGIHDQGEECRSKLNLRPAYATLGMKPGYDIYLYPGSGTVDGKVGDHILMAPAYNVTRADIELIANTTTRTVVDFFAGQ
ncbi:hypothetical protein H2199_007060 [Coniosporium tulheliwenetii]|uniref:Uncharacterized protein n=1 Tax=Coniosporium tulheliwenetii TaxID=3383036 RepID=A0ACC2YSP3_9PEZI|nr:hypothetical protein H2199_007060 [Cladosporium sp. JES 115]